MEKISRWMVFVVFFLLFWFQAVSIRAEDPVNYSVSNFYSRIRVEKDASLNITEKFDVNFSGDKKEVYRSIPNVYKINKKNVKAKIGVLTIIDGFGRELPFSVEEGKDNTKIKIGSDEFSLDGVKNLIISYTIKGLVLDSDKGPELNLQIIGNGLGTKIDKVGALVISPYAKITKVNCYGCPSGYSDKEANFDGGQDLKVVLNFDAGSGIIKPNFWKRNKNVFINISAYLLSLIPLSVSFYIWFKKNKNKKFLSEKIEYFDENKNIKDVSMFFRHRLPSMFAYINNYSSLEIGTIKSEKMTSRQIVSEILELARLDYLVIKKTETKNDIGVKKIDYEISRTEKPIDDLDKFEKIFIKELFGEKQSVLVSSFKIDFINKIKKLKENIYIKLKKEGITEGQLEKGMINFWLILLAVNLLVLIFLWLLSAVVTKNPAPIFVMFTGLVPSVIGFWGLPKKTIKGYVLHRNALDLKNYLDKGKWKEEIREKNMFFEEILPVSVSLQLEDKLMKDMRVIGARPPKYFLGTSLGNFTDDISDFCDITIQIIEPSVPKNKVNKSVFIKNLANNTIFGGGAGDF